jgi:diguanylate cyclase (GGDEF)-like protein
MIDVDKFKRVNDTFGHDAGDAVLREVADLIRALVRTEDIVARYGGEEFCCLLPDCSVAEGQALGQRLRRSIAEHRFSEAAGATRVTVSVGVAPLLPADSRDELFSRADRAMYEVKARGGDGVFVIAHDASFDATV